MPNAHNVIKPGRSRSAGLLVAADFPATGRTVAGFSDLVAKLDIPDEVWETTSVPVGTGEGMTAADHLDRWLADTRSAEMPVHAVLGFCVGAVFAAALAERIAADGDEPVKLIVFDPERPDPDLLLRHFDGVLDGLSAGLSPGELATARSAGQDARRAYDDMPKLAAVLSGLLAEHGGPALRRAGLDEARSAELVNTFTAFLSYLVTAAELDPLPAWRTAVALSSATPHSGLNPLPEVARTAAVARELRYDLPHTELLRDTWTARDVQSLLLEEPWR